MSYKRRAARQCKTAKQFIPVHRRFAWALQASKPKRAGAAGDRQRIIEHSARRTVSACRFAIQYLDAFALHLAPGAGLRRQSANEAIDLVCRLLLEKKNFHLRIIH